MNHFKGAVLMLLALLMISGCSGSKTLVLRDADSHNIIATWPLTEGEPFSIEFTHSVNKSPVIDEFTIEGDRIRAVKTTYSSLGAGVQTELGPGETLDYDESGRMVISGFQQTFESLNLIVGTVSDHILTIQGKTISLTELCGRNAAVTFAVHE